MQENKEKTVRLINAILQKQCPDFNVEVTDMINSCVIASIKNEMDEFERKLSLAMIFEVCDNIRAVPLYGRILIPKSINVIDLNNDFTFREDVKVTDEEIEKILNDPILNED